MMETLISTLAIVCSLCVATLGLLRRQRADGFRSTVYLAVAAFAGLVALLNLTAVLAADSSFIRTATLAYVGFATALLLPAARAFGRLTYDAPQNSESEDPV